MGDELEIEPTNGHKVRADFWRHTSMWFLAGACGALLSWNVYINDRLTGIREEQIRNSAKISEHDAMLARINSTGVDDRFRRQDFVRENEVWNFKFNALQRACEQCCERGRLNLK